MADHTIDELLEMPAWVIDILPEQVPAGAGERYFTIENWMLSGRRARDVRRAFAEVLAKLNCYYDFIVFREYDEEGLRNPAPDKLVKWVLKDKGFVNVLLEGQDVLIGVPDMSTYMSVFNPNDEVLELLRQLAGASGLFLWKARE